MKKLFILLAILLPVTSFGYATEELDSIFLNRHTGYAPYESLKQTYREVCVEPRVRKEAELKEFSSNKSGMLRDAFQSQIGTIYAKYDSKACEAVVSRLNVAYTEYLEQPKEVEQMEGYTCTKTESGKRCTPNQVASTTEQQIEFLQKQIADLILLVSQILALQSK